jgi:mannitol/fructose-specific phosphotransferase system IIA component (Ntr-type)
MFRTDFAMVVISAATVQDLIGWIVFAVILGQLGPGGGTGALPALLVTAYTFTFAALALTALRWVVHRVLPWVQAHATWPGGVIGFVVTLGLAGGALAEGIGLRAIFGSFLIGVALGSSSHLREHTRAIVKEFVSFVFAPIFFVSIGLRVDFLAHFDAALVLSVLGLACATKILAAAAGARLSGSPSRESWAIGFAMNARGAMEIVLGSIALAHGLIGERLFVALVVTALATSLLSGPAIRHILRRPQRLRLEDCLRPAGFVSALAAADKAAAIAQLAERAARLAGLDPQQVTEFVVARERTMATGLAHQIAVPHARIPGLAQPVAVVGLAPQGIDFDAPDGQAAKIIVLLLTPPEEPRTQLELIADVASRFAHPAARERALTAASFTEFKAALRSAPEEAFERPPAA